MEFDIIEVGAAMNVTFAVLADYANITREGKINILGMFNIIHSASFPYVLPQMQLVMSFEASIAEAGRVKKVEIQLIDEDGKKLFTLSGEMAIGQVKSGELFHANHIVLFNNVKFKSPGNYRFDIFIDGQPARDVPIKVIKSTSPS